AVHPLQRGERPARRAAQPRPGPGCRELVDALHRSGRAAHAAAGAPGVRQGPGRVRADHALQPRLSVSARSTWSGAESPRPGPGFAVDVEGVSEELRTLHPDLEDDLLSLDDTGPDLGRVLPGHAG